MIHPAAFRAQVGPGLKCVLLALWDFSRWKPGTDARPFVWPSRETLASKLGVRRSALDRSIRLLEAEGWIVPGVEGEHEGWTLLPEPERAAPQLDLFAGDEAVDNSCTANAPTPKVRRESAEGSAEPSLSLPYELYVNRIEPAADDDDGTARLWTSYERRRVELLGGNVREGSAPASLRALIAAKGLAAVEAYATRALELAREAVSRDRQCAATLVLARSDGHEWHPKRFDAVARYPDPPRAPVLVPKPPPPPDPVVDGQRVTLHEREAYERGGDAAVQALRAQPELTHDAAARILREGAPWLRIAGGTDHV